MPSLQNSSASPEHGSEGNSAIGSTFEELLHMLWKQHELELSVAKTECPGSTQVTSRPQQSVARALGNDALEAAEEEHSFRLKSTQTKQPNGGRHSRSHLTYTGALMSVATSRTTNNVTEGFSFHLRREWMRTAAKNSIAVRFDKLMKVHNHRSSPAPEEHDHTFVPEQVHKLIHNIRARRGLISPSSKKRAVWDIIGFLFLMYDFLWIPMQVFGPPDFKIVNVCDTSAMLYWTLDMGMSFISGYYEENGFLVMKFDKIAKRYLRTWFAIDIVVVGIDWLLFLAKEHLGDGVQGAGFARIVKLVRVLRIARTLRLVRVMKLREFIYACQEKLDSEYMMILISMMQNLTFLIILCHYVACGWYLLGNNTSSSDSWVKQHFVKEKPFETRYFYALHWSLVQFTPGGSNVLPVNDSERGYTVVVLLVAVIVGSTIISSITAAMTRLRNLKGNQLAQFFMLRKFLNQNQISRDLSARLTRYIKLTVELHRQRIAIDKVDLLKLLSDPLEMELRRELVAPTLTKHAFFGEYMEKSLGATSQVCYRATSAKPFSKLDVVFSISAESKEMHFVHRGTLLYRRMKGVKDVPARCVVDAGWWACEAALWVENWLHFGTMRAFIESEVIILDSAKFREITISFHDVFEYAKTHAANFVKQIQSEVADCGYTWDIPLALFNHTPSVSFGSQSKHRFLSEKDAVKKEVLGAPIAIDSSDSEDGSLPSMTPEVLRYGISTEEANPP